MVCTLLREISELILSAVEEFVRHDNSVPNDAAGAVYDIEIRGKTIRRGDRAMLGLDAANRDPRAQSRPDGHHIGTGVAVINEKKAW